MPRRSGMNKKRSILLIKKNITNPTSVTYRENQGKSFKMPGSPRNVVIPEVVFNK